MLKGLYADPSMIKYNGMYYIYPTSDGFPGWSGTVFHAFSSPDLNTWKDEGIIVDVTSDQVPWAVGSAWAPAMFERNGKFYFAQMDENWELKYYTMDVKTGERKNSSMEEYDNAR